LRVAVDPGHGGQQDGAIGPTRIKEKDANLRCAMSLAERLRQSGATVIMTLDRDSTLGLPDRTSLAEQSNVDILISLHHNGLPDGVNPFGYFGTGTYYYRPQSRALSLAVQRAVVDELGLPDEGVYYNDLALVRPTAQLAILLESAYLMLPEQEELIGREDYPNRLARAVEKGITSFVHERLTNRRR
jgi:N-acetylmuramoyl-L-alanine amidase